MPRSGTVTESKFLCSPHNRPINWESRNNDFIWKASRQRILWTRVPQSHLIGLDASFLYRTKRERSWGSKVKRALVLSALTSIREGLCWFLLCLQAFTWGQGSLRPAWCLIIITKVAKSKGESQRNRSNMEPCYALSCYMTGPQTLPPCLDAEPMLLKVSLGQITRVLPWRVVCLGVLGCATENVEGPGWKWSVCRAAFPSACLRDGDAKSTHLPIYLLRIISGRKGFLGPGATWGPTFRRAQHLVERYAVVILKFLLLFELGTPPLQNLDFIPIK